jgi:steroid Delta-isomerase
VAAGIGRHMTKSLEPTATREDAEFVFTEWHNRTYAGDADGVLALYAHDAVFESPLVPRLLDRRDGTIRGHDELRAFFHRAAINRPTEQTAEDASAVVRGYRTGSWQFDGRTLTWEYPRQTPTGDQIDLAEHLDLIGRTIVHHRVYWGWVGTPLLTRHEPG